jgi:hypothetical protein
MRRLLNQCANAAVKRKGSIFEKVYRGWCRDWDTPRPSGRLRIVFAG